MNPVGAGLAAALGLAGCGVLAGAFTPAGWRARLSGALTCLSGAARACAGLAAVIGTSWEVTLPHLLPLAGVSLAADALSGWFLLLVGAVCAVVGVYTIGYAGRDGRGPGSRTALALLPVFTSSMLLVPVAASVPTLLVG